jgi:glutathione S-transferase
MAPPLYRLYSPPGSFFAFAPLIVSQHAGVSVEIVSTEDIEQIIASKSPTGKSPILETKKGEVIFSSQAIARFIANLRRDTDLLGADSLRDTVAIDDWTNWATQELELPVSVSYYMITECIPFDETNFTKAKNDIVCALNIIETHLEKESSSIKKELPRTYLVLPEDITLADIVISCYLVYPFTLIFDKDDLKTLPNVMRWFQNCVQQTEFVSVLGKIECGKSKR